MTYISTKISTILLFYINLWSEILELCNKIVHLQHKYMQSNCIEYVLNNLKLFCSQYFFQFFVFFLMFKNWGHKTLSGILFWFILLKSPSKVMHVLKFLDQFKKFFLEILPTYCARGIRFAFSTRIHLK